MKLHACIRCGARFPTYRELQEHVTSHSNVCVKCNRVFSRQATLKAHKCKVGEFWCESCNRSYSTQTQLTRHKRETSCRHSLPPEAKRRKMTSPIEEMEQPPPPPLDDEQDPELQYVIRENWASIRIHTSHGPVQSRYNIKLTTSDTRTLELGQIFLDQTTAFKINLSYGFILRNRTSRRYKFYHSSCNCCGRYLDEPSLIMNADTFEIFLEQIKEPDILKWAQISTAPNGEWQSAYENLDIPNLHLEEGLPTAFEAGKRNIVVLDDLMAETDTRVTNLFTKKSHYTNTSVIYLVQNLFSKTRRVAPLV